MILDYNYKMRYCSNRHTLTLFIRLAVTLLPLCTFAWRILHLSPPSPTCWFPRFGFFRPEYSYSEIYAFAVLNGELDWRVTVAHVSIYRRGRGIYILSRCLRRM